MCAVPNMAVFCSSLTSWFPGMLLTYFLNVFEIVPVAPLITGITFVFTFHMRCISIVRSLYFRIFSASSSSSSSYYYYYYYYILVKYHIMEIAVAVVCVATPYSLTATVSKLLLLALNN